MPIFSLITVFGGATIDRLAHTAGRPVLGASNPGGVRTAPGGVGYNVATSLARMGLSVRLVSIVGADPDGDKLLRDARAAGVDTGRVVVSPVSRTATYQAAFDDRGDLVIGIADMDINQHLDPPAIAPAMSADDAGFWVVDANLPPATLDLIVGEAGSLGRPVAALAVSPAKAVRFAPLVDRLDFLFANRREAAAILGRSGENGVPPPAELAAELGRRGTGVVVTDSAEPIRVASAGETRAFVPFRATVRNVNGAGDALAAGTIFGLSTGRGLFDALRFGLAAAALAVERDETVRSDLTASRLTDRLVAGGTAP